MLSSGTQMTFLFREIAMSRFALLAMTAARNGFVAHPCYRGRADRSSGASALRASIYGICVRLFFVSNAEDFPDLHEMTIGFGLKNLLWRVFGTVADGSFYKDNPNGRVRVSM